MNDPTSAGACEGMQDTQEALGVVGVERDENDSETTDASDGVGRGGQERVMRSAVTVEATRRAESELARCLGVLMTLFPEGEFKYNPPAVKIQEGFPPLAGQPLHNPRSHLIRLYRRDLNRPLSDILTILLHQAVHAANGFAWLRDCNAFSYHNERFRTLAEQVGLEVRRIYRYGWAETVPRCWLQVLFRGLELCEEVFGPFRNSLMLYRSKKIWHCGLTPFPEREQLEALGVTSPPPPARLPLPRLQGMKVHKLWQGSGYVPLVRLSGKWLRAFGFRESVRMKVEARYGQLTLQARDLAAGNQNRGEKDRGFPRTAQIRTRR